MSEWQPKVGEVVAVRRVVARRGDRRYDTSGRWWMANGDAASEHDIAPWLSADEHSALMRLARAAVAFEFGAPALVADYDELSAAIDVLPTSLRAKLEDDDG